MALNTVSINDRLGDGGLENVVIASTDASGATVLVGAGGVSTTRLMKGEFVAAMATYLEVPTSTQVVMPLDDVRVDTLGIWDEVNSKIVLPADISMLDWDVAVELASTASGYGNTTGARSIVMPPAFGMGTVNSTPNPVSGTGVVRGSGFGVSWDHSLLGSEFQVKFSQNSGSTIRVGDSTGTGNGQTWVKFRLY